jgi:hypothetical protein
MRLRSPLALATFLVLLAAGAPAYAQDAATCEVVEVIASNTDKPSIDPDLGDLKKKLSKGPFAGYNTFKKSARLSKRLEGMKEADFDTPRGKTSLILRGLDKGKKRARISLGIEVAAEDGKRYVETRTSVDAGDFLLFGYTPSEKETVITAIGCK